VVALSGIGYLFAIPPPALVVNGVFALA